MKVPGLSEFSSHEHRRVGLWHNCWLLLKQRLERNRQLFGRDRHTLEKLHLRGYGCKSVPFPS